MGWLIDNMNALENYQNNAMQKARQEREDAYQNEQRDRLRVKQADEDKSNAVFDTEAEAAMARIGSTPEKLDVRKMYKLPSATPPAPGIDGNPITPANPTAYPIPQGSEPAPVAAPPVAQPVANVPVTRSYVDDAEDSLKSQARLFKAKRDAAGFQSAINSFNKVRQGREDAAISAFVMNGASPEDMTQLASNITLDKQNGFKAAYDPVTKITRYELGEVKADLTRPELARILVAQNRIAKGDPSALDDIAKVHQGLAAKIKDDLKLTYEVTQANNKIGTDQRDFEQKSKHDAVMLAVSKQNANTNENYRRDMAGRAVAGQTAPVWDKEADAFLKSRYSFKDEATGVMDVDGAGLQFAKALAATKSRLNGGDTTSALGFAFDADKNIKNQIDTEIAAGRINPQSRQQAINTKRQQALTILMTPKPAAPQQNFVPR